MKSLKLSNGDRALARGGRVSAAAMLAASSLMGFEPIERDLGVEGSRALHLHLPPGRYDSYPNGAKDDTHYNAHGATLVAELVAKEIRRLDLPLRAWLKDE